MTASGTAAIYTTALSLGMIHGIEPGHGWPVAAMLALNHRRRWWVGLRAAVILAAAHLLSSVAVVALYATANRFLDIEGLPWLSSLAGALLLLLAVHQWRAGGRSPRHEHPHTHEHDREAPAHAAGQGRSSGWAMPRRGLLGLAGFAFVLGFVHEEEFAIIALSAGKASVWAVMGIYAIAVAASLVALTCLAIGTLNRFEHRLRGHQGKLPRISAGILAGMGLAYLLGLL